MSPVLPRFFHEQRLFDAGAPFVIGVDEVGRGAIAGPVTVGVAAVHAAIGPWPDGLRDSKLLAEPKRESLHPLVAEWVAGCWAVGEASAEEIDRIGIVAALGLAGTRALDVLFAARAGVAAGTVLLDGAHDWLTPALARTAPARTVEVRIRPKADRDCASVAAASVLAKVHRDRFMRAAHVETPGYGWDANKGYGSAAHRAAVSELGPSPLHRISWLGNEPLDIPA
ncbi:ribonuclease HII [Agromyces archimandritae]|uniref:Ribonuclease n=1 Tax=Agromyces archimandritae TaxID=2781962 RepID=A0A975FL30_9MICO|nr:ribonuclease HII [Agromyces archimandritae]QTX04488.1 ribonuclease HII [Agromyces archimandritae]